MGLLEEIRRAVDGYRSLPDPAKGDALLRRISRLLRNYKIKDYSPLLATIVSYLCLLSLTAQFVPAEYLNMYLPTHHGVFSRNGFVQHRLVCGYKAAYVASRQGWVNYSGSASNRQIRASSSLQMKERFQLSAFDVQRPVGRPMPIHQSATFHVR